MTHETQIYAKEQQILIANNILDNLCPYELTNDGRKYVMKIKERIKDEIIKLESSLIETSIPDR